MKITLKEWKEIERAMKLAATAIAAAENTVCDIAWAHRKKRNIPEYDLLNKLMVEIHEARDAMPNTAPVHPQSEWMGGDSNDSNNHKLREPNICPLPRRKFSPEEIEEAGAVCLGPVQWEFPPRDATRKDPE